MKTTQSGRRSFISKIALGSLATLSIPEIAFSAMAEEKAKKISIKKDHIILFQGDSITDAGRSKTDTAANIQKGLGTGYVLHTAAELFVNNTEKNLTIYNRGISGNKVYQLAERWDNDAINLKPDILSILIGVNDFWHMHTKKYNGTLETYKTDFKTLLSRTIDKLPDVKLIIGQPFALIGTAVDNTWFPAFNAYQQVALELSNEFNATFLPYQKVFDKALKSAPGSFWAPDGVHPSVAGAKLMAETWLQAVKG